MIIISHKAKQSKRKKKKYWQKFKPWFQDFQRLFLLKKCQTTELKSLEALQEIAKGDANKVFIPFEATNTLSSLGAIKEIIKDK